MIAYPRIIAHRCGGGLAPENTLAGLEAAQVDCAVAEVLAGLPWACYTVNHRTEADRLFALGCAAIFTDRPDLWQPDGK